MALSSVLPTWPMLGTGAASIVAAGIDRSRDSAAVTANAGLGRNARPRIASGANLTLFSSDLLHTRPVLRQRQ